MINRGRFQAQGNGLEKSTRWATDSSVSKMMGNDFIDNLQNQLTTPEFNERNLALIKARRLVNNAPAQGIPGQIKKSFFNTPQNREVRIDVEINSGHAFLTVNV